MSSFERVISHPADIEKYASIYESRPASVCGIEGRPTGYEDVHAELGVEDAVTPDWRWELSRDEGAAVIVAIDRPEGYERAPGLEVVREADRATWPTWSVLNRGRSAAS